MDEFFFCLYQRNGVTFSIKVIETNNVVLSFSFDPEF